MHKKIVYILAILTFTLAACASAMRSEAPAAPAMESSGSFGGSFDEDGTVDRGMLEVEKEVDVANTIEIDDTQRMVIKNADLSIIVKDPLQKLDDIVAMAEEMGGYVVDSNVWQNSLSDGTRVPHVNVTIRVPADDLDDALNQIKSGVGEIVSENVSGQDITRDYTDLKSRLRNLEAAEAQLQEIMDEATTTEDVLQVYNNLVSVREQIEVIKGQMQYYEDAARLSRISVDITADEEAQPIQIGGWQPVGVAKDAVETMINALQILGDIAIWFILCVLPIGILVGIPLYLVVRYVRRLRKRMKSEKTPEKENTSSATESSEKKE